jgi:hypothetical protein
MAEDYYTTLAVHRSASAEEIGRAYRELARKYHPDLNPNDSEAERRFEEVQAAFEVLSDPDQRAAYNRTEQSFATTRGTHSYREDDAGETEAAGKAFAEARRQSRSRPSPLIWQGSVYGPPMVLATIAWLIALSIGIGLLVVVYLDQSPSIVDVSGREEQRERLSHEESESLTSGGRFLCFGGTVVYGIVMAILLREYLHQ